MSSKLLAYYTHHATIICMKEVHNFLTITVPQINIATVTATDDKLTARTVEVHSLHCKHAATTAGLIPKKNFLTAK